MTILVGDDSIIDQLSHILQELGDGPTDCYNFTALEDMSLIPGNETTNGTADVGGHYDPVAASAASNLNWGVLTAAALVDSINPCAIAVLLILLGGLVMSVVPPREGGGNGNDNEVEEDEEEAEGGGSESSSSTTHATHEVSLEQGSVDEILVQVSEKTSSVVAVDVKEQSSLEENDIKVDSSSTGATSINPNPVEFPATQSPHDAAAAGPSNNAIEPTPHNANLHRRAFISGMAFILSVFISYYLLGFGVFTAISSTEVSGAILLALGIFIIILGLWNIKDFLCYETGYNVEIPRSWRPLLKKILGTVTSPIGAFAAGFIVCLFELPCTGGPYLFILGLLGDKNTRSEAAFSLLYYNFIFVLPLIVINCLVFWGASMLEKVGAWKDKYIRHLHLVAGLVLIGLGTLAVVDSQMSLF